VGEGIADCLGEIGDGHADVVAPERRDLVGVEARAGAGKEVGKSLGERGVGPGEPD
jgi:hypothetical protein